MTAIREARPRHLIVAIIFLAIAGYAAYQARFVALGPRLAFTSHTNGTTSAEALILLEGTAKNVSHLSLNGRQIFTDREGLWSERFLLSQGPNIMTLRAKDRFGHEAEESIQIFLSN